MATYDLTKQSLLKDLPVEKNIAISHVLKISNIELKDTKNKSKKYLSFDLSDSSAKLSFCKKWDSTDEDLNKFKSKKLVYVSGKTDTFNDSLSIVCENLEFVENEDKYAINFLPKSAYDIAFLKKEIWKFIQNIQNKHIRTLCLDLLKDPEVKERFPIEGAAANYHHNYISGLCTHVLRLMYIADSVVDSFNANQYPGGKYIINKDVVIALALFHDIYKIREYSNLEVTDIGGLVPHLPLGAIQANRLMDKISDFPEEIRLQITHGILCHHNKIEYGSPVTPATVEGMLFSFIDDMCAKVDPMLEALNALPKDVNWTEKVKAAGKKVYMGGMLINQLEKDVK